MTNISLALESGPINVDPGICKSTKSGLEISTANMINLKESRGTETFMCLLPIHHSLSSDTYLQSSGDIEANSALKSLPLKNLGRMIIGYLNINCIRNKFETLNVIVSHNLNILTSCENRN